MTVTLDLPPDAVARLEAEAQRRGVPIDVVVAEFAATLPAEERPRPKRLSFIALGASSSGATRDIDEMLAEGFGRD